MAKIKRSTNAPVTVDELKNHLHIYTQDFDAALEMNIRAAVAKAESYINAHIWQVEQLISVPFALKTTVAENVTNVIAVQVDEWDVNFTLDNGVLTVEDVKGEVLTYIATKGYSNEECPADIKMAILLIAAKFFNNPVDSVENLPSASQALLHPYKNYCI